MLTRAQLLGMDAIKHQAWNPTQYDSAGAFVPRLAGDLLELLAPNPGERVLDLGCGTGDLTAELKRRGAEVLGVDSSSEMVAEAARKHPDVELRVGDGQALAFDGKFEAVFSNASLHWMPRADDVASGVRRALVPGGRFVAELGGARCVETVRHAVHETLLELGVEGQGTPSWFFPSVPEYALVLERAGLWVRSLSWFERPTCLKGQRGLEDWLELFCLPLLQALGDQRADLVARVEARCRPRLFQGGDWWLDYTRLRVVATRPLA
jgi:trans-aconitate methyltransferase